MANKLKSNSSGWVHKQWPSSPRFRWQIGYGGFTVGYREVPAIKDYIDKQREHHRTVPFAEELRALYEEHGIAYDERYLL